MFRLPFTSAFRAILVATDVKTTMLAITRELVAYAFLICRQRITVKKTGLRGICFFREHNLNTSNLCLVLDFLEQVPERDVLEVLFILPTHLDFLLPAIVLADNQSPNTVLETVLDDELACMVEVVFNAEVPLA